MSTRTQASLQHPQATEFHARPFSAEEMRGLLSSEGGPCVSLYLNPHKGASNAAPNRFEALITQAEKLITQENRASRVTHFLEPLRAVSNPEFWRHAPHGLAFFLSPTRSVYYRLPIEVEDRVIVADNFHLRPLMEYVQDNQRFYLLVLSEQHVSFFKGSMSGLAPVPVPGMHSTLVDALGTEDHERQTASHQSSRGGRYVVFGGAGHSDKSRDEDMARFYRTVDAALWRILREDNAPMVLAGSERDVHVYERISRYPHLTHEHVHGNHQKALASDLHKLAMPVIAGEQRAKEQRIVELWNQEVSPNRALDEIRAIAQYAVQGRVRHLMIERGTMMFGQMDPATGALRLHKEQSDAHDDDVLDEIAEAVLMRGGEVYSLEKGRMPTRSPIAATLRW